MKGENYWSSWIRNRTRLEFHIVSLCDKTPAVPSRAAAERQPLPFLLVFAATKSLF